MALLELLLWSFYWILVLWMSALLRKSERVERLVSRGWWNEKKELLNEVCDKVLEV